MSGYFFKGVYFFVVLIVYSNLFAESLDASLNAQRKKAHRRVYSERIQMDNQQLVIPREYTKEERAVDDILYEMETKLDTHASSRVQQVYRPRTRTTLTDQEEVKKRKNWLASELIDQNAKEKSVNSANEKNWTFRERETVNRTLREKTRRLASKQLENKNVSSFYTTSKSRKKTEPVSRALSAFRQKKVAKSSPFSSRSIRSASTASRNDTPSSRSPNTPLKQMRRSSRTRWKDPFSDDMQKIKRNIWE